MGAKTPCPQEGLIAATPVCEVPFLAQMFGFAGVDLHEYLVAIGPGAPVIPVAEPVKRAQRRLARKKG